jgi:hypothetical protein
MASPVHDQPAISHAPFTLLRDCATISHDLLTKVNVRLERCLTTMPAESCVPNRVTIVRIRVQNVCFRRPVVRYRAQIVQSRAQSSYIACSRAKTAPPWKETHHAQAPPETVQPNTHLAQGRYRPQLGLHGQQARSRTMGNRGGSRPRLARQKRTGGHPHAQGGGRAMEEAVPAERHRAAYRLRREKLPLPRGRRSAAL